MTAAAPVPAGPVPAAPTTRRPDWLSIGLAALVAAFLLATPGVVGATIANLIGGVWLLLGPGLVTVAGVLVVARWPIPVTLAMLAPFAMAAWTGWFVWGWLLGLFAATVAVTYRRGWRWGLVPATAAIVVAWYYCSDERIALLPIGPVTAGAPGDRWITFLLYVFWTLVVLGGATTARAWARAGAREHEATREREEATAVATLAAERARMARDLHDVVAHHVSLIVVRTESAPFQLDLDEPTRELLSDIGDDARGALAELRHALAVLQRSDDEPAATRPQPTVAEVADLLAQARAAGQQVEDDGDWGHVATAPGYVLYRAVQEGLTNARRHAPGERVTVRRVARDAVVGIEITNPTSAPDGPFRRGRGLLGMAERVAVLGGSLEAGVKDGVATLTIMLPADGGEQ